MDGAAWKTVRKLFGNPVLYIWKPMLHHEKLDVYQCAVQFLALSSQLAAQAPRGHSALVDQLKRAALSVPLNIAEAAGKTSDRDSSRSFVIARGSALECAAVLDACLILRIGSPERLREGKELLRRIVCMLTKMIHF